MNDHDAAAVPAGKDGVTPEVGDEGGTPGDVEIVGDVIGTGSEAGETWRPADESRGEVRRDEDVGRRTP